MTQALELVALARENVGKGSARAERRNKRTPAVIYGGKTAPAPISLETKVIMDYVNKRSFFITLFDIKIGSKKHSVLPRDVEFHPVSDLPLHIDFLRVTKTTQVRVRVPLHFVDLDKSPGLKRGGNLNVVSQDIEVLCSAMNIPEQFEISVDGYVLGQSVRMEDITLPKGAKLTAKDLSITIASIAVPSALRSKARDEAIADGEEGEASTEEGEASTEEKAK